MLAEGAIRQRKTISRRQPVAHTLSPMPAISSLCDSDQILRLLFPTQQ